VLAQQLSKEKEIAERPRLHCILKKNPGRSLIVVIVCSQVARRGRSLLKLPCEIPTFYVASKKSKQLERGTVVQSEDIRRSVCKMVKLAAENSIIYS